MDTPFFQFIPLVKSDSTSPNSDRNQTPFLGKIRPKSDQKSGKNQTLFHNLTTLTLLNVPAGINVPYSYSERIVKYSTFAEKSDFCWPIQTFFGPLFQKKSEFGPSLANSDHNWQHCDPSRIWLQSEGTDTSWHWLFFFNPSLKVLLYFLCSNDVLRVTSARV